MIGKFQIIYYEVRERSVCCLFWITSLAFAEITEGKTYVRTGKYSKMEFHK
jgi:hypothetical protein